MTLDELKHAQRQRLLFLDRCFTWRGIARRRDLTERFGISTAQAANDFRAYLKLRKKNPPEYDGHLKAYVASPDHAAIAPSSMQDAFNVLMTEADNAPDAELPRAKRWLDSRIATGIYDAIEHNRKIKIQYTSISSGETAPQWVAPTRFTFDGETIHFRAYSFKRSQYRKYHPARIEPEKQFETNDLDSPLPEDKDWNTLCVVWLRPLRSLSPSQARVVRREYGFTDELLRIETRQALEHFLDRRWGLNQPGARLEREKTELVPMESIPK